LKFAPSATRSTPEHKKSWTPLAALRSSTRNTTKQAQKPLRNLVLPAWYCRSHYKKAALAAFFIDIFRCASVLLNLFMSGICVNIVFYCLSAVSAILPIKLAKLA